MVISCECDSLSLSERTQLVEDIWDSIAVQAESVELTEKDKNLIDERLKTYHENPDLGSPWEEVYNRNLRKKMNLDVIIRPESSCSDLPAETDIKTWSLQKLSSKFDAQAFSQCLGSAFHRLKCDRFIFGIKQPV
jgi:putative addiction module component (TIGR02574 family)